jgi:UDP-N-acetyl-D-mannosaminuronic acid transferase (WecB/TagA/CpsF family)
MYYEWAERAARRYMAITCVGIHHQGGVFTEAQQEERAELLRDAHSMARAAISIGEVHPAKEAWLMDHLFPATV